MAGFVNFIKSILFGKSMAPIDVVIVLEWILTAYGIGMTISTKHLITKILNILVTILWVVCAVKNMIAYW